MPLHGGIQPERSGGLPSTPVPPPGRRRSGAIEDDDAGFQLVDQQPSDAQILEHVVDAVVTFKAFAPVGLTERTNREVRSQALYPAELRARP